MCMEDVKIARNSRARAYHVTVTNASTQLVGPSLKRIGLIISPPAFTVAGTERLSVNQGPVAVDGDGIVIPERVDPFTITYQDHGALAQSGLWAICAVGSNSIGVVEIELEAESASELK